MRVVLCGVIFLVACASAQTPEWQRENPSQSAIAERFAHLALPPCEAIARELQKLKSPPATCPKTANAFQQMFKFFVQLKQDCEASVGAQSFTLKSADRVCSDYVDSFADTLRYGVYRRRVRQNKLEAFYLEFRKNFLPEEMASLEPHQKRIGEFQNPACERSWNFANVALVKTHEVVRNLDRRIERVEDLGCWLGEKELKETLRYLEHGEK